MKHAAAVFLTLSMAVAAVAQDAPEISRADLAVSLLRFELAMKNADLDPKRLAEVNKAFDVATLAFFQQRFPEALSQFDALAIDLMPDINHDAARRAASMRVSLEPAVFNLQQPTEAIIHCTTLYPPGPEGTQIDAGIAILAPDGTVIGGARPKFISSGAAGDSTALRDAIDFTALDPGRYQFVLVPGSVDDADNVAKRLVSGSFLVVDGSLDAAREANETRIAKLHDAALTPAITAVSARNALLTDSPDPSNTAQLMLDLADIAQQVDDEINALANGTDPYAGRTGDYWTTIKSPVKDFPARVYLPASADASQPLTVLIAFHGAGGDENMFMDAYGAGAIKNVADEHALLLVTPLTYAFGTNTGEQFDALIQTLEQHYTIDAGRIFIVGHSMGGGAVSSVINARGDRLAGAAALCGFRPLVGESGAVPPTLVVAAELDPIASPARIEPFAQQAIEKGLPIEYRLIPNYGHTVIVGDYVDDAVAWMLEQPLD